MINWNDLQNLHIIRQTKNIIHRWWKVDLLIIDEKNLLNYSAHKEKLLFQNPLTKALFQKEALQDSFFKTLLFIHKQNSQNTGPFLEKWPETGLNLFISPIQSCSHTTGFVVAIGFLMEADSELLSQKVKDVKELWPKMGFSQEWSIQHESFIPHIPPQDKNHFIDLMQLAAKEIADIQNEFIEKKQTINELPKSHNPSYGHMVGKSPVMQKLYNLLDKIKHSHNIILIQGENGTGKELIAKSIHFNSPRKNQAFIIQNCSALNDNLLESELFGHVKGSFTGAYKDKKGLFELADMGTFFLDEVGDTSPSMQVKLLRVIQEGTFFPVGGIETKKVDVRIIAATNKNLKKMVAEGTFREDLYYRLNVINIQVPPLREREEDITFLAEFFINQFSQQVKVFTKKALEKLTKYHWPGNVRELQNEAERLAVFTGNDVYIKEESLSDKIRNKDSDSQVISLLNTSHNGKVMKKAIAQLERQMIAQCLKQEGWNKTKVAKKLGISRAALVSKVKDYKLEKRALKNPLLLRKKTGV
ncbi:MAG: sigma-54 dependent transcriptional regulator [Bdellovibrionales bacterium]|nr:sigma-54 dependent transcriptional regulator [Bdellovibrionales bacterium]